MCTVEGKADTATGIYWSSGEDACPCDSGSATADEE